MADTNTNTDGFQEVVRRKRQNRTRRAHNDRSGEQGQTRGGGPHRGRGRGKFNRPRVPDFSNYVLRPAQINLIVEWIEKAAEEWLEKVFQSPFLCSQEDALHAIYMHWWDGLVELRTSKNLDTDPSRNAYIFRTVKFAREQFASNEYLRWAAGLVDPGVVIACCALRAGDDMDKVKQHLSPWWCTMLEKQLAFTEEGKLPLPAHGMPTTTPEDVADMQLTLLSEAQALLKDVTTSVVGTPIVAPKPIKPHILATFLDETAKVIAGAIVDAALKGSNVKQSNVMPVHTVQGKSWADEASDSD